MHKGTETLKRNETGEVMLEAALLFPMILVMIMLMISVGFVFYQKAMMQSVAEEIASDIAAGYKYTDWRIWESNLTEQQVRKVKKYRTSLLLLSMKNRCKSKAEGYLGNRVSAASLGVSDGTPQVDSVKLKVDNVGRVHIEVCISMQSEVVLERVLKSMHILDDTPVFTATAYAECMDITAYASQVHFLKYAGEKLESDGGAIGGIMDNLASIISHIRNSIDTVEGSFNGFVEAVGP